MKKKKEKKGILISHKNVKLVPSSNKCLLSKTDSFHVKQNSNREFCSKVYLQYVSRSQSQSRSLRRNNIYSQLHLL